MWSPGLKFKIFIILVLLLAAGMLLVNMVIVTFWQRDLIQREQRYAENLLRVAGIADMADDVAEYFVDARCGVMFVPGQGVKPLAGLEVCSDGPARAVARNAAVTAQAVTEVVGTGFLPFLLDRRRLLVAVPVKKQGRVTGAIALAIPFSAIFSSIRDYRRVILVSLLVNLIVLSVVGLFRFIRSTVRPIENLVRLAESYSEIDSIPFLMLDGGDEFGQLSGALNRMMERIEKDRKKLRTTVRSLEEANRELRNTQKEMLRTEKLASVGRLAAGMAHEIGNPLGIVQGYMELLKMKDLPGDERLDYAERAEQELQRVNGLIRQLLDFSRTPTLQQQQVSLHEVLASLADMVRHQPFLNDVELICSFDASRDSVLANPDQLRQVFLNCVMNSADAIATAGKVDGRIEIRTWNRVRDDAGSVSEEYVYTAIVDNGMGVRQEDLDNVFDPFFTTKEPGKGTGLGLSVSHSIVTGYGGGISMASRYGEGTTVEVWIPLVQNEP